MKWSKAVSEGYVCYRNITTTSIKCYIYKKVCNSEFILKKCQIFTEIKYCVFWQETSQYGSLDIQQPATYNLGLWTSGATVRIVPVRLNELCLAFEHKQLRVVIIWKTLLITQIFHDLVHTQRPKALFLLI